MNIAGSLAILSTAIVFSTTLPAWPQSSTLVYYDQDKNLVYSADNKGNKVPDFSHAGYRNGEYIIPVVPIVKTINPVQGDNRINIQSAIDEVAARTPDSNGFRGAVFLRSGIYNVSGRIDITASGIVLIGEGPHPSGTHIIATLREQHNLIHFRGSGAANADTPSLKKIITAYLPIGAKTFVVESGHSFIAGNDVFLERRPNQQWIEMLGMHTLNQTDPEDVDWTPTAYIVRYKRKVMKVSGDTITIDAPVMDPVNPDYAEAFLRKYTWPGKITNVGIENIRLISEYSGPNDENHGWNAVRFDNVEDGWVRNVEAYHFGYSAVNVGSSSSQISVLDSKCIDPMSQTTGGRKYSFNVDGQRVLVKNCWTRGGRHDYVTGARVAGPNVFVNCTAVNQRSDIGPHHRWATGILFDNIKGDGSMNVENRLNSGTGHGWAGAQTMYWNCTAKSMIVHNPPGDHVNWAVGNKSTITDKGTFGTFSLGFVESTGTHVVPESLYEVQLAERLGHSKQVPEKPGQLKGVVISGSEIELTWTDNSDEESAYLIEQSSDGGVTWSAIAVVSQNVTKHVVADLMPNKEYNFRIRARNGFGYSAYSEAMVIRTIVTSLGTGKKSEECPDFRVYPNPFQKFSTIEFVLDRQDRVKLAIIDCQGREMEMLIDDIRDQGRVTYYWYMNTDRFSTGTYFVKLSIRGRSFWQRILLLK
jgi:hypothetical protein